MKLYALAKKFEAKYFTKSAINASDLRNSIVEHIEQAIANASTVSQSSGIMPFVKMLTQDSGKLSFMVTRNGSDCTVTNLSVQPTELTSKYQSLPDQVTKYLNKNLELFPTKFHGDSVSYNNFTFTCHYGTEQNIASIPE